MNQKCLQGCRCTVLLTLKMLFHANLASHTQITHGAEKISKSHCVLIWLRFEHGEIQRFLPPSCVLLCGRNRGTTRKGSCLFLMLGACGEKKKIKKRNFSKISLTTIYRFIFTKKYKGEREKKMDILSLGTDHIKHH